MKQILSCILFGVLLVFVSCQTKEISKEIITEPFEIDVKPFVYEQTKGVDAIAVDEEGYLYTATCITELEASTTIDDSTYSSFMQRFQVYNLEGTCIKKVELALGTGSISFLTAKENKLYCIVMKSELDIWGPTLYSIDTKTWKVNELYQFETYSSINNFVLIGDYFYVIGCLKEIPEKEYTLHPDIDFYTYQGECISRIKIGEETPQEEILPVDFPMDIVETTKDTLLIYHYNEENGFGFLEFNPKEAILTEVGWRKNQDSIINLTQCKDGFLFEKDTGIYYGTLNNVETRLSKNEIAFMGNFAYQRGFLFYMCLEGIERIGVNDLIKNNTPIHLLLHEGYSMPEMYDSGYQVEKSILEPESYALKVLARDTDFDMYLLKSRESIAYNIKEKGVFYALNEVAGVQEYLDACFPYLKEVATNENGDIWMIPVESVIFSLFYHKEYSTTRGVDLSKMDLFEFLTLVEEIETKESEKGSLTTYLMIENFLSQYVSVYDSFDTEIFRKYAKQLRQIEEKAGKLGAPLIIESVKPVVDTENPNYTQEELEQIPNFLYEVVGYHSLFWDVSKRLGISDIVGMTNIPRLSEEIGNVGMLTFLAVNPQAENLEVTLDYISDFCKYMMTQKDTFLLVDETLYTDTPIVKDRYQVYKEGEITFAMDLDVYWNDFWDYIDGEMELEEMIEEIERKRKIYVGE